MLGAGSNALTGLLPSRVATMRQVDLGHNLLSGGLPLPGGPTVSSTSLTLAFNRLSGRLPADLMLAPGGGNVSVQHSTRHTRAARRLGLPRL